MDLTTEDLLILTNVARGIKCNCIEWKGNMIWHKPPCPIHKIYPHKTTSDNNGIIISQENSIELARQAIKELL